MDYWGPVDLWLTRWRLWDFLRGLFKFSWITAQQVLWCGLDLLEFLRHGVADIA